MMSDPGDQRIVNVDLSSFQLDRFRLWPRYAVVLGAIGFFLLLALFGGDIGKIVGLGAILILLLALAVFAFWTLPHIFRDRMSQSTTGTKLAFLKAQDIDATAPGFDRPMSEILAALQRFRDEGRVAPTHQTIAPAEADPSDRRHANAYRAGAGAVVVIWLVAMIAPPHIAGVLPTLAMMAAVTALLTRARRVMAPSAEEAVRNDGRPPILFLRSFKDDTIKLNQHQMLFGLRQVQPIRFEEALGAMVGDYGPFLAVGEPHEGLPQLGAARAYLSNEDWQAAVLAWIGKSRMISMLCGPTRWVHWEMQNIVAAGRLDCLLLFMPPGRTASGQIARRRLERWDNIVKSLDATAWGAAMRDLSIDEVLLIQFIDGGRLRVFQSRGDATQDYELATALAIYAILQRGGPIAASSPAPMLPPSWTAPEPPARVSDPTDGPLADRWLALKLAPFGLLAGLIGFLPLASRERGVLSLFSPVLLVFPALVSLGVGLFYRREPRLLGWLLGVLTAASLANAIILRGGLSLLSDDLSGPGFLEMLIVVLRWLIILGALALRFRVFRKREVWLWSGAAILVTGLAQLIGGAAPVRTSLGVLELAMPTILAASIGFGFSRRPDPW